MDASKHTRFLLQVCTVYIITGCPRLRSSTLRGCRERVGNVPKTREESSRCACVIKPFQVAANVAFLSLCLRYMRIEDINTLH